MSLITYIFSSILLSLVGIGAYFLFRTLKPGLGARRLMLWLVVILSLGLPLTPAFQQSPAPAASPAALRTTAPSVISPVSLGHSSINDFCHCSQPHAGDVILYRASQTYDFLLRNKSTLLWITIGLAAMVWLRFVLRLALLMRHIRRSPRRPLQINGQTVWLVQGWQNLAAGSFGLFRKFIFWSEQLGQVSPQGQEAILQHEFAHLKQQNTLEKLILSVLKGIWLLNPAHYLISRELELLSEFAADEYAANAMGSRKAYAHLLLDVKTSQSAFALQMFRGSCLKARITRVLDQPAHPRMPMWPAFVLFLGLMFQTEMAAQSVISEKMHEIKVYEFLSQQSQETGEKEFCKKCTYEAVEDCQEF